MWLLKILKFRLHSAMRLQWLHSNAVKHSSQVKPLQDLLEERVMDMA